jgi:1-deoxy-D-xylulose-5-phosphate reductoisomerase
VLAVLLASALGGAQAQEPIPEKSLNVQLLEFAKRSEDARARKVLDAGAAPDSRNRQGETALFMFARDGNLAAVTLLVGRGASVDLYAIRAIADARSLSAATTEQLEAAAGLLRGELLEGRGALLAHLGHPDMAVPISFALTYPERAPTSAAPLDLSAGLELRFEPPDLSSFPLLALAREAGERGGTFPCGYNAANEVAVGAFLDGRIGFLEIAGIVERVLGEIGGAPAGDIGELVTVDAEARRVAEGSLALA